MLGLMQALELVRFKAKQSISLLKKNGLPKPDKPKHLHATLLRDRASQARILEDQIHPRLARIRVQAGRAGERSAFAVFG